ncbi:helix-turn-helix domain-containing protein [Methylocystis heyeri]|uniref:Helix-turn-helix domain-containing protein n=1 Tax=Methylocystis heyeri TaxID=391905 RepID=A0A6B8KEE3_9HYPH|nr:helix-turn-helix domain-containing protein [Methylocystis heyeri]
MSKWAQIVRELLTEKQISVRELARCTRVSRSTLHHFLNSGGRLGMEQLERIMSALRYTLAVFDKQGKLKCQSPPLASVHVAKSLRTANAALVKSGDTKKAAPDTTRRALPLANVATTANGIKPAKISLLSIRHA